MRELASIPPRQDGARPSRLVELLRSGNAAFGVFAADGAEPTAESLAACENVDFVFYDMERGPFDVARMEVFQRRLAGRPMVTRLPPIRDGFPEAAERAHRLVAARVHGVVFPHIENRLQAEHAVRSTGPGSVVPAGGLVDALDVLVILIIEDRIGVDNAGEIASTPGVDVVIPGPGDLGRAYGGDAVAVEAAIQTVLAASQAHGVVCGITAGTADMEKRREQGFRFIIATSRDALTSGVN